MTKQFIHLRSPTLIIGCHSLADNENYRHCCDYFFNEFPQDTLKDFKLLFEGATIMMRKKFGNHAVWENVVFSSHGGGNELGLYGGIDSTNMHTFAKPMKGKVKDIWLAACAMGGALSSMHDANHAFELLEMQSNVEQMLPEQLNLSNYGLYDFNRYSRVDSNTQSSNEWYLGKRRSLAAAMERIKPGSVEKLRKELESVNLLGNEDKCREAVYARWLDFNAKTCYKMMPWVMGFAPKLATETGANVWASPHIQVGASKQLRKGTIDHFEGDLYKFAPWHSPHLVSRRPIYSRAGRY